MKNLLSLMCLFLATSVFAINPITDTNNLSDKFETSSVSIDAELSQLNQINNLVLENNLTFEELSASHADLVTATKLSATAADGILDGHPDSPAGIPAFWWGFCLGWVGMLVVYLTMDEGSDRKEQVMNALWGCVVGAVVYSALYVLFWVVIFSSVN